MTDWGAIFDALYTWAHGQTGLAVVWAHEPEPRPAFPFGVLTVTSPAVRIGGPDETRTSYDPNAPAGAEVTVEVGGLRRLAVSFQVATRRDPSVAYDAAKSAVAYVAKAQTALALPSVVDALSAAGLAVINADQVQDVSAVEDLDWVERVNLDIQLGLADVVSETTTYIERATVSSQLGVDPDVELVNVPLGG